MRDTGTIGCPRALPHLLCGLLLVVAVPGCGEHQRSPAPLTGATAATAARAPRLPALCRARAARALGRVQDPQVDELSGLVRGRRDPHVLWANEDSGAPPVLIALTPQGRTLGHLTLAGAGATDWEDVAAGPGPGGRAALYAADIGDNAASRDGIQVYRVDEPSRPGTATVAAARIELRYPDGPHDAETLIVDPIRRELVIVTKGFAAGRVYTAPADGPAGTRVVLRRGRSLPLGPITAGDISRDGRTVALRTYGELVVWRRHGREGLTQTLARVPACTAPADLGAEGQGEALALAPDGRSAITVPEGRDALLRRYG